ncbi:MAG: circadian clock KaiB family protein [Pseudomonadota bacterium]
MAADFKFTLIFFGENIPGGELKKPLERLVELAGKTCELELIDLSIQPEAAVQYHVLATPLLIRSNPLPIRRFIGHLTDSKRVARALGIDLDPAI